MLTILCALKWRISVKGPCRNAFLAYTFNLTKAAVKSRSFFDIAKNIFIMSQKMCIFATQMHGKYMNKIEIRNSTAEFLIFQIEGKEDGVQVLYKDETIWCTQEAIATLFDKAKSTISEHLKNIFESGELVQDMVVRKFRTTTQHGAIAGKTQSHEVSFYNLDAIVSTTPPLGGVCTRLVA